MTELESFSSKIPDLEGQYVVPTKLTGNEKLRWKTCLPNKTSGRVAETITLVEQNVMKEGITVQELQEHKEFVVKLRGKVLSHVDRTVFALSSKRKVEKLFAKSLALIDRRIEEKGQNQGKGVSERPLQAIKKPVKQQSVDSEPFDIDERCSARMRSGDEKEKIEAAKKIIQVLEAESPLVTPGTLMKAVIILRRNYPKEIETMFSFLKKSKRYNLDEILSELMLSSELSIQQRAAELVMANEVSFVHSVTKKRAVEILNKK